MSGGRVWALWATAAAAAIACGGPTTPTTLPATPPPGTQATLVGPRCEGQACKCRDLDRIGDDEGKPEAGRKRFELRVGPSDNEQWVTLDGMVLYKGRERATECFYVDLATGDHQVSVRAREKDGVAAAVTINELSTGGPWWYRTVELDCTGRCTDEALRAFKQKLVAQPKHLHDPCGSTKVLAGTWETAKMPDAAGIEDVRVAFSLKVYAFATGQEDGPVACRGGR